MKKILKKLISFIFRDRLVHDTENKKTNKQKTEIEDIISLMIVHFHQKEFLSLGNCS